MSFFHHLVEVGARGEGNTDSASGGGGSMGRAGVTVRGSSGSSGFFG